MMWVLSLSCSIGDWRELERKGVGVEVGVRVGAEGGFRRVEGRGALFEPIRIVAEIRDHPLNFLIAIGTPSIPTQAISTPCVAWRSALAEKLKCDAVDCNVPKGMAGVRHTV